MALTTPAKTHCVAVQLLPNLIVPLNLGTNTVSNNNKELTTASAGPLLQWGIHKCTHKHPFLSKRNINGIIFYWAVEANSPS